MPTDTTARPDDEIDLRELGRRLYRGRRTILIVTTLATFCGVAAAFLIKPTFRAEVLMAPVLQEEGKTGLSALADQYSGLAALAGLSIGGSGGSTKDFAIATLKSRQFTDQFIRKHDLLPILFESDWNADQKRWKEDNPRKQPSLQKAYKLWDEHIREVTEERKTGLVTLRIEWEDPKQAADWASGMVTEVNEFLRQKAFEEAERNMKYLEQKMNEAQVVAIRDTIAKLLEVQMRKATLANANPEYAFKVIDPAQVPEKKIRPQRALISVISLLAGTLLGAFIVLVVRP